MKKDIYLSLHLSQIKLTFRDVKNQTILSLDKFIEKNTNI